MEPSTLLHVINEGGALMWPLYLLLVATVAISVERVVAIIIAARKGDMKKTQMERPLAILDLIAMIAPVTGFLGTVTGMIHAFKSVSEAASVQLQTVASGLYEALFTTAFGLIISILATIFSFFLDLALETLCEKAET